MLCVAVRHLVRHLHALLALFRSGNARHALHFHVALHECNSPGSVSCRQCPSSLHTLLRTFFRLQALPYKPAVHIVNYLKLLLWTFTKEGGDNGLPMTSNGIPKVHLECVDLLIYKSA